MPFEPKTQIVTFEVIRLDSLLSVVSSMSQFLRFIANRLGSLWQACV